MEREAVIQLINHQNNFTEKVSGSKRKVIVLNCQNFEKMGKNHRHKYQNRRLKEEEGNF